MIASKPTESLLRRKISLGDLWGGARTLSAVLVLCGTIVIPLYASKIQSDAVEESSRITDAKLREFKVDMREDLNRIESKIDRINQYLMERRP